MNWNIIKIRFKRLDLVKDKTRLKKINASYLEMAHIGYRDGVSEPSRMHEMCLLVHINLPQKDQIEENPYDGSFFLIRSGNG